MTQSKTSIALDKAKKEGWGTWITDRALSNKEPKRMPTAAEKIVDEIVLSLVDFHLDNKANVRGWKFVGSGMEDDEYPDIGIYIDYEWGGEETGYVYIMDEEEADELETEVKVAIIIEFLRIIT